MSIVRSTGDVIGFLLLSLIAILEGIIKVFIPRKYKMKSVTGEIALVTGGGGGLGRLISLRLANLGAIVVVWDINKNGIDETVSLVQSMGGTCYGYICNLCDREDVYKKAAQLQQEVGKVSILINNAGVVTGKRFLETSDELLIKTMDVNVMSHFWAEGYNINTTVVCPYFIRSTGMFEEVQSRFVPTLSPNEVADRVITAMRCNEKIAILPSYLQGLLAAKWIFPWTCVGMFLRGLVRDASPKDNDSMGSLVRSEKSSRLSKDEDSVALQHQKLARRMLSSEKKL
ncbi:epidermal retinol dehydrogenase 2-like isoform X2 [Venturia canescens]|uniref:epidermal retinol dehydrogenase 2-like isoform X2 n=1 Tax=Venturia canescens TaxID=32260 RepID=UPI001C9C7AB5|nr:epidermal retinol dehydrogenase 2-like isoform X2 [Venturia canescens]